jgi:hypothetical protein
MLKTSINAAILLASVLPAFTVFAAEPQLICFGNEPSWSLQFSDKSRAQLLLPEQKAVDFLGQKTHLLAAKQSRCCVRRAVATVCLTPNIQ